MKQIQDRELHNIASSFWRSDTDKTRDLAHWRGCGRFTDTAVWRDHAKVNVRILERLLKKSLWDFVGDNPRNAIEWGCGGGANICAFGKYFSTIYGVDISEASLVESKKQSKEEDVLFFPIKVDIDDHSEARKRGPFDLFISTAVFQHFVSINEITRTLNTARAIVKKTGRAFIQWRDFRSSSYSRRDGRRGYKENVTRYCMMTKSRWNHVCVESHWHEMSFLARAGGYMYSLLRPI